MRPTYATGSQQSATSLTHNEARHFVETGEMAEGYTDRCKLALELEVCENCDGRKCMGCIFRECNHDCGDNCPDCCDDEAAA